MHNSRVDSLTIFCLHFLGGSSREWELVEERLPASIRIVAIDLPGFGDAADTAGYSVAEMAKTVARAVRSMKPRQWMLAGHSMGAKVAAVVARSAEDGAEDLSGLKGIILLAGSPPGPEPMDEDQRQTMLGWFRGGRQTSLIQAQGYIDKNVEEPLDGTLAEQTVADVLRAEGAAWRDWLESGSLEDWSQRVGVLQTPALIIAGEKDVNLGPDAQLRLMAPHFAHVRIVALAGAKHLLPLECPDLIARLFDEHATAVGVQDRTEPTLSQVYCMLMASNRVSIGTRRALEARAVADAPAYEPVVLNAASLSILRAVLSRVIPQGNDSPIDLAARIDKQLASGVGDGWRVATLPPDAIAYRAGILSLDKAARTRFGQEFTMLSGTAQDNLLRLITSGQWPDTVEQGSSPERLSAGQMRSWFEDLRADAVKLYVAHPEILARLGYSGIANGGDGMPKSGFSRVGVGEREEWEPAAATDRQP